MEHDGQNFPSFWTTIMKFEVSVQALYIFLQQLQTSVHSVLKKYIKES